jgi:creatinine amidohydrolase
MPLLENSTMERFEKEREACRTVIIPCGSVEEHGIHLPLGTDTLHAAALAARVAQKIPVWVCPPIWYGLCRSSGRHPGTVGIRASTLQALVKDVIASLYEQGMRHMVVLSGHAGGTHMAALINAGEELLTQLEELNIAVLSVLDLGTAAWNDLLETADDSHAGEVETSIMLHLYPHLVEGTAPEEYPSFPRFILVRNKRSFWPGGVWGNPQAASAEKGSTLLERSAAALIDFIQQLENWSESDSSPGDSNAP